MNVFVIDTFIVMFCGEKQRNKGARYQNCSPHVDGFDGNVFGNAVFVYYGTGTVFYNDVSDKGSDNHRSKNKEKNADTFKLAAALFGVELFNPHGHRLRNQHKSHARRKHGKKQRHVLRTEHALRIDRIRPDEQG